MVAGPNSTYYQQTTTSSNVLQLKYELEIFSVRSLHNMIII